MIHYEQMPFNSKDLEELKCLDVNFVFQPIFHAKNMEIVAYEALMRPLGKTPLELIEEYRNMNKLHVIELATTFGAAMECKKRGCTTDICINSFPSEALTEEQHKIYYACFPDMIGRVIVEIVEYTDLNRNRWARKKDDIQKHHMRISIDDYSIGNNDMSAVEYYRPQYVKLDRLLVSDIHKDKERQEKINELIRTFHGTGIQIVAEGIETVDEFNFFRNNTDVDLLQGYYLGMPE